MSGPALLDRIDQAIRKLHAIRAEVAALELPNIGPNGSGEATLARSAVERAFRGEIELVPSEPLDLVSLCPYKAPTEPTSIEMLSILLGRKILCVSI